MSVASAVSGLSVIFYGTSSEYSVVPLKVPEQLGNIESTVFNPSTGMHFSHI